MEALPITGSFPYHDVVVKIALALGIGLVVGLEREWAHKQVGARTFAITTLLGTLTTLLARELLIAALVAVVLLVALLNVHSLLNEQSLEMTTSAALLLMVVLGALIGEEHYFTAAAATILVTLLLGLMSFVIYPLLPDRFVDPWRLINPRQAWVTVVVIAGIGFLNYVLLRLY